MFSLLRNCQTVFQDNCTVLRFHQQYMRVLVSPDPSQHLAFLVLQIIIIQMGMQWYVIMVLTCISLIINVTEHLFMSLVGTHIAIEVSVQIFCQFYNWFVFLLSFKYIYIYVCVCIYIQSYVKYVCMYVCVYTHTHTRYQSFIKYMFCTYFLPGCVMLFHFLKDIF